MPSWNSTSASSARRRLAEQIYRRIRAGIQEGQLRPADPLPSSRELADRLTVSRNTVTAAYDRLGAEGLIDARPGVGAFVSVRATRPGPAVGPEAAAGPRPQPLWASLPAPEDLSQTVADFDLRSGIPSRAHFPYSAWRSLVSGQLRQSAASGGIYGEPAGSPALRPPSPDTWPCRAECGPAPARSSSPTVSSRRSI